MDALLVVVLFGLWWGVLPVMVGRGTHSFTGWRLLVTALAMWVLTTIVGLAVWLVAYIFFRRTQPAVATPVLGGQLEPVPAGWGATAETAPTPAAAATKQCPDCAERIQLEARICRFCRYEFTGADDPARLAVARREERMRARALHLQPPTS